MESGLHNLTSLFQQLGLPSTPEDIQAFIARNRHLNPNVLIFDAPIWTQAQADFLREQIEGDADWAVVIDKLNTALCSQ
ncbi:MAG TPA: DUF2789 domain-containing protein [Cellvibrio sp.]|nr:DUF2789 domain-containing protein [Cellvibrio sp.]